MKKRILLTSITTLLLVFGSAAAAHAEIIPPRGGGQQIGPPAVVLCDSLTVRKDHNSDSAAVDKLSYGSRMMVVSEYGGWAECAVSDDVDAGPIGWVNADYIAIDPAYYVTEDSTPVYAWDDEDAPKVAMLGEGKELPILREKGDWYIVSLRGATGWIRK